MVFLLSGSVQGCSEEDKLLSEPTPEHSVTATAPTMETVPPNTGKATSLLQMQIDLRNLQITNPSDDRLEQMEAFGMQTDPLNIQKVFIYLNGELTESQVNELESLGVSTDLGSWIRPVGNHPSGFLSADITVESFDQILEKEYVVRLDTAERLAEPQIGAEPGLQ